MKSKSLHTLILGILLPVLWITATNSASGQQLIPQPNQVTRHEGASYSSPHKPFWSHTNLKT